MSVLDDPEYVSQIAGFWSFWCKRIFSFSSLDCWWNDGKRKIRRLSMDYCKRRAAAKRVERDLLTRLADFLKQRIDAEAMFCFGPYQTVLSNLAKLDLDAARSAEIRSRTRWVEESESSTSYFFRLVKKQSADRLVSALRFPDGSIDNSAKDLADCFASFYSSLFSAEVTGLLIFRAVAEPRNSGKSAKSREIHKNT